MSMKPCKKSDSKKKWMSDRRDRHITIAPEYHLIVTEGTKTEPQYFEGVKNDINNLYRGRISIVIEGIGQGIIGKLRFCHLSRLWSNECIEYWFLLHFMALDSALNRNEYYPKLTECLGSKYKKPHRYLYIA